MIVIRLLLLLSCIAATPAWAAPYFEAATLPPTLLPAPPAPQSEAWKRDVAAIVQLQAHADAQEVEKARAERHMSPEMVAQTAMPSLTRATYPAVYALLDRVAQTSGAVNGAAKKYWNTKRPYLSDAQIKSLIEPHDNPAYPSGHTCGSFVWAHVLSLLIPAQRDAFYQRAEEISQHRVLVGMHYPHDVGGGKLQAMLITGALLQNAAFQQDMKAAQAELSAHR